MTQIRIASRFAAAGAEVEHARLLVDVVDAANNPLALGDLILEGALLGVVEIEMTPPVALRRPDHLASAVERARQQNRRVDERHALLFEDRARHAGGGVDRQQPHELVAALDLAVGEPRAVGRPFERRPTVIQLVERLGPHRDLLAARDIEGHELGRRQIEIDRQRIGIAEILGPELVRRRRLRDRQTREVALIHHVGRDARRVRRPEDRRRLHDVFGALRHHQRRRRAAASRSRSSARRRDSAESARRSPGPEPRGCDRARTRAACRPATAPRFAGDGRRAAAPRPVTTAPSLQSIGGARARRTNRGGTSMSRRSHSNCTLLPSSVKRMTSKGSVRAVTRLLRRASRAPPRAVRG